MCLCFTRQYEPQFLELQILNKRGYFEILSIDEKLSARAIAAGSA
jgi:hypothetical protein